jgi:hypothetical protein
MTRLLTNLKFWALALALTWIVVVVAIIATHPELAHSPR